MRPSCWQVPVELSTQEERIVAQIRRAKLFVFLRHHRHELFDETLQQELAALYRPSQRGHPPIAPAQLALVIILQAYTGVSDDEVRDRDPHGPPLAGGVELPGHRSAAVESKEHSFHQTEWVAGSVARCSPVGKQ